MTKLTFDDKFENYVKASYPFLWVTTHEESKICRQIVKKYISDKSKHSIYEWDAVSGLTKIEAAQKLDIPEAKGLAPFLDFLRKTEQKHQIFLVKDFHVYLENPLTTRALRNLIPRFKALSVIFVFISPIVKIPVELEKEIQLLEYSLPDETALEERLEYVKNSVSTKLSLSPEVKQQAIQAAKGMTSSEAENAFTLALVENKQFNAGFVSTVFTEKVQQIKKGGLFTYLEPDVTFEQIGGLQALKSWIKIRTKAYEPAARDYGLPWCRGMLLTGIPGTGKTLVAKATAHELNLPLFQLDIGSLFDKLVGATEQNFRKALQAIDSFGACVLLMDEVEKALNKSAVSGQGDSGVSSRSFGTLLTWLSDHQTPVFVVATSNKFTILPPEMLRKGRFDELWWLDLPVDRERYDIFTVQLRKYKRDPGQFNIRELTKASVGLTGAEIEHCIVSAMFDAYATTGKDITTDQILNALQNTVPQSTTNKEELDAMRQEAITKLRVASSVDLPPKDKPHAFRI